MTADIVAEIGKQLAEAQKHELTCEFLKPTSRPGCTCGAVQAHGEVLGEFWRQYRLWKGE